MWWGCGGAGRRPGGCQLIGGGVARRGRSVRSQQSQAVASTSCQLLLLAASTPHYRFCCCCFSFLRHARALPQAGDSRVLVTRAAGRTTGLLLHLLHHPGPSFRSGVTFFLLHSELRLSCDESGTECSIETGPAATAPRTPAQHPGPRMVIMTLVVPSFVSVAVFRPRPLSPACGQ